MQCLTHLYLDSPRSDFSLLIHKFFQFCFVLWYVFRNNPVGIIYSGTITLSFCSEYINFLNFVGRDPSLPSQGRHLKESLQDVDVDREAELLEDLVIQGLVILSKLQDPTRYRKTDFPLRIFWSTANFLNRRSQKHCCGSELRPRFVWSVCFGPPVSGSVSQR